MRNIAKQGKNFLHSSLGLTISFLLSLGFTLAGDNFTPVRAESVQTAPEELKTVIGNIEQAANDHDLEGVMKFYSPEFETNDGLRLATFTDALSKLWENYPDLQYQTILQSWERKGGQLVADTVTEIKGTKNDDGRQMQLTSIIRSRQYFSGQILVSQEIISESSNIKSGENPPEIRVILPEEVKTGTQYNFDVIVEEPLLNDLLLGTAIEEQTGSDRYLNPSALELELLSAGGIFKLVTAPLLPDNRWVSAIIVRDDGINLINQRVRVIE